MLLIPNIPPMTPEQILAQRQGLYDLLKKK